MRRLMTIVGAVLGIVSGTLVIAFLGWSSLIAPEWSDNLHQRMRRWSESDD